MQIRIKVRIDPGILMEFLPLRDRGNYKNVALAEVFGLRMLLVYS